MPDTNESFDLPRWQTHVDPLSSSAQAAHAAQASYLYSGPPPPPPQSLSAASPQRLQSLHHSPTGPSRQPRISQLLDQDQQLGIGSHSPQYISSAQTQLSRSASLGGGAVNTTSASRARRHHQPDDLEVAFSINTDTQAMAGPRQQLSQGSFYSPSIAYQPTSLPGSTVNSAASPTADSYPDMYYNASSSHPPKRIQTTHDAGSSAARTGRSPFRLANPPNSASLLDPYGQQAQYSPTTAPYSYN
ncbi:hypothetical protein BDQ12DRAFT_620402, partial [Crucibulum laeve]